MPEVLKRSGINKSLVISCLIAAVLLLVSNSAIWANRHIFSEKAFTETAVTSLTSQSSRDAIASKITDEALQNHPRIQNIVDDSLVKLISGLLDGDRIESVLSKSISKLHIYVTSSNQEDVAIDLTGFKDVINRLIEVSERTQRETPNLQKFENIPDQVVLIQADNIPDFYNYGVAMTLIAPLAFLGAVILLAYPYIRNIKNYLSIMLVQGLALISIGLAALLIGPIFRPITLGSIQDANARVIAGNLYDSYIATFNTQTSVLIIIGLGVCIGVLAVKMFRVFRSK